MATLRTRVSELERASARWRDLQDIPTAELERWVAEWLSHVPTLADLERLTAGTTGAAAVANHGGAGLNVADVGHDLAAMLQRCEGHELTARWARVSRARVFGETRPWLVCTSLPTGRRCRVTMTRASKGGNGCASMT